VARVPGFRRSYVIAGSALAGSVVVAVFLPWLSGVGCAVCRTGAYRDVVRVGIGFAGIVVSTIWFLIGAAHESRVREEELRTGRPVSPTS
jgi:hypothetical protein